jgi:hypothetical protein
MEDITVSTIKVYKKTKRRLDKYREYKNESYDEVINKLVYIADNYKKDPKLSAETIDSIEKARKRIKYGKFISEDEAKKRLGL